MGTVKENTLKRYCLHTVINETPVNNDFRISVHFLNMGKTIFILLRRLYSKCNYSLL
jgi:hypothetical protein